MTYNFDHYYGAADFELVFNAHQSLAKRYCPEQFSRMPWYWNIAATGCSTWQHHREVVEPFTIHSGSLANLPLPLISIWIDSQIKTYMDRDALGDIVKLGPAADAVIAARDRAREAELAKRVGGSSFHAETQIAVIEYNGYVLGGMMANPGRKDKTVATIMNSPIERQTSIGALQANYSLPADDPFLARKESEIIDLIKYFRLPDSALKRILPASLLERTSYRKTVHLIRALTISEVFALTERWMKGAARKITTGVCETPNEDVKLLFHGKKMKAPDGTEVTMGGIPHRVLTAATGVELYPIPYKDRPEGKTKIYTLYAFDFDRIAAEAKVYRAQATLAYRG